MWYIYSSWCYQVSDSMGESQASCFTCIMRWTDHAMRSVEDLCYPILIGLLDTFTELKSNLFPGSNTTASNSLNAGLMTSIRRSCLARFGALDEIDLESWVEKPFKKMYQQIFPFLFLLSTRVSYLLSFKKSVCKKILMLSYFHGLFSLYPTVMWFPWDLVQEFPGFCLLQSQYDFASTL